MEKMRKTDKKISLVIPAWNEKDGIANTIRAVPKDILERMGYRVQILVVDGDSDDGTAELARQAGAEIITERRRGYGRAYKTGLACADGDIIATADADGSYPMQYIPQLVSILEEENLDFITTSRFALMAKDAMSLKNRFGNKILAWETRLLFRLNLKDPESGMWVFRRDILNKMRLGSDSWPFSHELKIEACYFAKCRWKEVPIEYRARLGETKLLSGWLGGWKAGFTDLFHIARKRIIR